MVGQQGEALVTSQSQHLVKLSGAETGGSRDLQRAQELVSLHYDVKVKYRETGPDAEFVRAGRNVDTVVAALNRVQ